MGLGMIGGFPSIMEAKPISCPNAFPPSRKVGKHLATTGDLSAQMTAVSDASEAQSSLP